MQDHDQRFGQTLLEMTKQDAKRAIDNPTDRLARSVALWMADQLGAYAASLPQNGAAALRHEARRLRSEVLRSTGAAANPGAA